tara:strand:- start:1041 stop:1271 length:231 start_codon:yes stop_codon:yes gene_type:complete
MLEYTSTRLKFKRDEIEALGDDDYFKIHVTNDQASYKMTKGDFYNTFNKVVKTKSYLKTGNYNYPKTPIKALKYIV